jgi:uncharacterized membrane protein YeaQ/YmgE (transglycosylase-associated protein family)
MCLFEKQIRFYCFQRPVYQLSLIPSLFTEHSCACSVPISKQYKSSIMNFIWYILIGILAGYFAGKIMRGGGFGLLVNLLLGIIGGVLGGWVFALLGLAATGIIGSLITSVVGAILFLWIASFFSRSR